MSVEILHTDDTHYIKELKYIRKNSDCELSWQCGDSSDYFLVISASAVSGAKVSEILSELSDGIIDAAEHNGICEYRDVDIFFVSKEAYIRRNKTYIVPIRKNYPLAINVFACQRLGNSSIKVYSPDNIDAGNIFVQAIVNIVIRENKFDKKFPLKKTIRLSIRIDKIENFNEYSLLYSIDGSKIKYPVTEALLGKDIKIKIPKGKCIKFELPNQYQKYYRLNVSYTA